VRRHQRPESAAVAARERVGLSITDRTSSG